MKIGVLGSSGQIGQYLVDECQLAGYDVIEWDIVNSPDQDLRSSQNFERLVSDLGSCDYCFFLAFDVGGSVYLKEYQDSPTFILNNMAIMANVFKALQITATPFLFASSQMSSMSFSPYGQCKSIGEICAKSMKGITTRFWNVYGYETDLEKAHVITDFLRNATSSRSISMLTDGSEVRQFLYARDCAKALVWISLNHEAIFASGRSVVDVTNGEWTSILEVAQVARELVGDDVTVQRGKATDTVQLNSRNEPDLWVLDHVNFEYTLRTGMYEVLTLMTSSDPIISETSSSQ